VLLALGSITGAYYASEILVRQERFWLEVQMASSKPDVAQLFFDTGKGYNEQDSSTVALSASDQPRTYRFGLPAQKILSLRFDVLSHEGRARIVSAAIVDSGGQILRTFVREDFAPGAFIRIASSNESGVVFETVPVSGHPLDPVVTIRNSSFVPQDIPAKRSRWFLLCSLSLFVCGLGVGAIGIGAVRGMRQNPKYRNPDFHFRFAIIVAASLTFAYALCFPLIVSYDGMEYTHLAYVLFSPNFDSEWNFYRTPLFPLALRATFFAGGEQPESALLVTTVFGFAGTLLVGATVRRMATGTSAAIIVLILAVYPVLIGYEHMLLSETGTLFFLALLLWLLTRFATSQNSQKWSCVFAICLALALGYYWRPTIIYLSPVLAMLYALNTLLAADSTRSNLAHLNLFRTENRGMLFRTLLIGVLPWLLAAPWMMETTRHHVKPSDLALPFGLYKQVVVPPTDPILRDYAKQYQAVIDRNSRNGSLPVDGVALGDSYELSRRIVSAFHEAGVIRLIERYPLRYTSAVIRSMAFYLGWPSPIRIDDESTNFARAVLGLWPSSDGLSSALGWDLTFKKLIPGTYSGGAWLGSTLNRALPAYEWLVRMGSLAAIGLFCLGVIRKKSMLLAVSSIPLSFLFLHALTALPAARYAFPAYPLLLANLVLCFNAFRSRNMGSAATGEIATVAKYGPAGENAVSNGGIL
jgi:4-amino-4-deoxy-L-arabinose transferase-like glycosyltransferase